MYSIQNLKIPVPSDMLFRVNSTNSLFFSNTSVNVFPEICPMFTAANRSFPNRSSFSFVIFYITTKCTCFRPKVLLPRRYPSRRNFFASSPVSAKVSTDQDRACVKKMENVFELVTFRTNYLSQCECILFGL